MVHPARYFAFIILVLATATASFAQKLCFPPHEGLPHHGGIPPTIDGYIDRSVGYPSDELETGWVRSSLVTYDAGSTVTLTNFRGLKDNTNPFLYLGFTVQFDQTFDDDDVIVLVLRPSFSPAAHSAQERRIDIYPVQAGVGAVPPGPDDAPPGSMPSEHIRTNRLARSIEYYRWDTNTSAYVSISPISNVDVKVRSWSNGATDNNWSVEVKLPTGSAGPMGGGTNWIDLTPNFGFYFNVIRVCNGATCGSNVLENNYTTQFPWPRAVGNNGILVDPVGGPLPSLASYEIPPSWLGEAVIGAGAGTCQGVHFVNGPNGIGTRDPANPSGPLSSLIDGTNPNTFVARVINDGPSAPNVRADFRIANWGLGWNDPGLWQTIPLSAPALSAPQTVNNTQVELTQSWTLTPAEKTQYGTTLSAHQCIWVLLSSASSVDFSESSVRRNMNFTNLSSCNEPAEISGRGYKDKPKSGVHDFLLTVNERFLTYPGRESSVNLAAAPRPGPVVQFPRGESYQVAQYPRDERDNVLLTSRELYLLGNGAQGKTPLTDWLWIVNGYRKTPHTLTINKKTYPVYESVGAFGQEGMHRGGVDEFRWSLSGEGLRQVSPSSFRLGVPVDKVVKINTSIEAVDHMEQSPGNSCSRPGPRDLGGPGPLAGRFRIFLDIGPNFPTGDFDKAVDGRFSINAGLERFVAANTSIEAIAGYHAFKAPFVSNPRIWQLSVNVKQYFGPGPLHFFLNGGGGAYRFDPGNTTKFGWNVGAGLLYDVSSSWGIEGVYNYHSISISPTDARFSTVQVGIRHRVF